MSAPAYHAGGVGYSHLVGAGVPSIFSMSKLYTSNGYTKRGGGVHGVTTARVSLQGPEPVLREQVGFLRSRYDVVAALALLSEESVRTIFANGGAGRDIRRRTSATSASGA